MRARPKLERLYGAARAGSNSRMPRPYAIEPMTLGNMRANGVRSLLVYCTACSRTVIFNVDAYAETLPVPAFGPRMVCTGCGMIGADARPNGNENPAPGAWRGRGS